VVAPAGHLRGLGAGLGDLGALLGDTRWGWAWIGQAVALALAVAVVAAMRGRERLGTAAVTVLVGAPGLALAAISWSGHASGGNDRAINIGAHVLHAWATAAWLGGLAALFVCVIPALRRMPEAQRVALAAPVVVRFSTLAVGAVAVLVVTGVYRALAEISDMSEFTDTAYGRALLVKLGIFALMLVAGAYNRFVIHPRLERTAMGLDPSDRGASLALRRSVTAELVLAAGVMTAVAVMATLPTPIA
jgi:copper transport protein